jgi:hypothetical protein
MKETKALILFRKKGRSTYMEINTEMSLALFAYVNEEGKLYHVDKFVRGELESLLTNVDVHIIKEAYGQVKPILDDPERGENQSPLATKIDVSSLHIDFDKQGFVSL